MNIDDIEIKIKKYNRENNTVIVNLIILDEIVIRGFVTRYTTTKHSPVNPVWIVSPPCLKKGRSTIYFWVVEFKTLDLWKELQERIIEKVREYTNNI